MTDLTLKSKITIIAGAICAALILAAIDARAEAYCWHGEGGLVGCTDDPERVPERYEPWTQDTDFAGYDRLTLVDSDAVRAQARKQAERLDYLRCLNLGTLRRPVRPDYPEELDELACYAASR